MFVFLDLGFLVLGLGTKKPESPKGGSGFGLIRRQSDGGVTATSDGWLVVRVAGE